MTRDNAANRSGGWVSPEAGISVGRCSTNNRRLASKCKRTLRQFGVNVYRCGITDFSTAKVYRLVGNEQVTG